MAEQGMAKGKACVPLILMEWVQGFWSLGSHFYLTARALQHLHLPQTAPKDQGCPRTARLIPAKLQSQPGFTEGFLSASSSS